jgi:hypothetical protein
VSRGVPELRVSPEQLDFRRGFKFRRVVALRGVVSDRVRRALFGLSRGRCHAPGCTEPIVVLDRGVPVCVGEVAHIVGAGPSGPRGDEVAEARHSA